MSTKHAELYTKLYLFCQWADKETPHLTDRQGYVLSLLAHFLTGEEFSAQEIKFAMSPRERPKKHHIARVLLDMGYSQKAVAEMLQVKGPTITYYKNRKDKFPYTNSIFSVLGIPNK